MTENLSNIEKIVMKRVHRVRVLRAIFSNSTLALATLTLALWGLGREVWVAKVFANGPQDFFGHAAYLTSALEHTHLAVQLLTILTLIALLTLARETARLIASLLSRPTFAV